MRTRISVLALVYSMSVGLSGFDKAQAATAEYVLPDYLREAFLRQDPTGQGSFHRIGMLRENAKAVDAAEQAGILSDSAASEGSLLDALLEITSLEVRANTMLFSSDNILNTRNNPVGDHQLAEFFGASLDFDFNDNWKLSNSLDQAYFRHGKKENEENDFNTTTLRSSLTYNRLILNNSAIVTIPLTVQYSVLDNEESGNRILDTTSYSTGVELAFFPKPWLIPTFSYVYTFQDPDSGFDKHKHDFNAGLTFVPFKGTKFFVIPSIQYSNEEFVDARRRDEAWTPTMTMSWQPFDFLAIDAITSYTDSQSSQENNSFDAFTGTLFARLFWSW